MAEVMTRRNSDDIAAMGVAEKWWLGTRGQCYSQLASQIALIQTAASAMQKVSIAGNGI